jgi:hypothetical protein
MGGALVGTCGLVYVSPGSGICIPGVWYMYPRGLVYVSPGSGISPFSLKIVTSRGSGICIPGVWPRGLVYVSPGSGNRVW